jgi:uncharacterized membrane protein
MIQIYDNYLRDLKDRIIFISLLAIFYAFCTFLVRARCLLIAVGEIRLGAFLLGFNRIALCIFISLLFC